MRGLVRDTVRTARRGGCIAGAVLLLAVAGCTSSDGGGGNVAVGGGQATDPVVLDFPIAYVKRPVPVAGTPEPDARRLLDFQPGADLFVRDRASPSATDRNVTAEITQGAGDVRDVEPSFDGTKLVFAMREPLIEGADEEDQPTWNIWEYDVTTRQLRRVIESDIVAEEGHDVAPHYLPDGRIVFTSTRQRQSRAVLLDEGKPQFAAQDEDRREPAFVLHVVSADGSGLRQISFNQSHDLDPAVLDDGRIVFSRWENAGPNNEINLYSVRPDGSQLELLYGAQSHATGTDDSEIHFLEPRQAANGRLLVRAQPFRAVDLGGQLLEIDVANYVENTQPTLPNRRRAERPGAGAGHGQRRAHDRRSVAGRSLRRRLPAPRRHGPAARELDAVPPGRGRAHRPVHRRPPGLGHGRPGHAALRHLDVRPAPADPAPGRGTGRRRDRHRRRGDAAARAAAGAARPRRGRRFRCRPRVRGVGILDIRSVYDLDGVDTAPGGISALADPRSATAAERPARFLRIEKAGQPARRRRARLRQQRVRRHRGVRHARDPGLRAGRARRLGARSRCRPTCPSRSRCSTPMADASASATRTGCRCAPAQELRCNGCHDRDSEQSHGRSDLFAAAYDGAPTTGLPFPNTNAALFADFGETMAQTRARISCQTDCAALELAAGPRRSRTSGPIPSPRDEHPTPPSPIAMRTWKRRRPPAPTA